ncbi:phosphodiesterase [Stutzerimonas stutzeri]|uniref:phosphodiesterase n=1 Tax=Stutzerimonas sp. S1 TaxID=3030652 RepID=UPI00222535ED|nr:phosphodiesterase [Stutzerimonas sp. S1]MCW3150246.1 phosphodiesterase [Stutzerimonas sp. S1]
MLRLPALLLLFTLSQSSLAEQLHIPIGTQGTPTIDMPARGEHKNRVLEHFGLADEEHPTVGKPPITRWDYREFSVYFENERVINSVRHHRPITAQEQSLP